ncbi:MAG TPA: MFS transporter [Lacipirellulaceae bacterium]|nr:MFS transporter [Lacipirellulaceae bacterium]
MPSDAQKLSVAEKIGYSLGDAAANFVFMTLILYQLNFYTDTFGIAAGVAGSLLLLGRLWDAFVDPMIGMAADRTNTRWGKFRPWVLWTALPWGVIMVLAYSTPSWGMSAKVVYACVTNILLMSIYSANNTPYSALTGVMTGDGNERTSLSSYRFVAAMIAQLVVGGFTLPLVAKLGAGNDAKGWQLTIGLWALICVGCFLITFLSTRERIQPDPHQKLSAKQDFGQLLRNGPWIAMFLLTLAHFAALAMRGGTMFYYFDYVVNEDRLRDFLQGIGVPQASAGGASSGFGHYLMQTFGLVLNADHSNVASVGFSLFNMFSQFVTVVGVCTSTFLAMRFGKRGIALVGFSLTTIFMAMFYFVPSDRVGMIFLLELFRALSYAPTIPLLWAMFADVADFAEWKTGRRTTGIVFATIIFALKVGLSLGGAIAGWLLSGYGYQPKAAQTSLAVKGITLNISVFPAMLFGVCIACLIGYKITKRLAIQIEEELAERRTRFAGPQPS